MLKICTYKNNNEKNGGIVSNKYDSSKVYILNILKSPIKNPWDNEEDLTRQLIRKVHKLEAYRKMPGLINSK